MKLLKNIIKQKKDSVRLLSVVDKITNSPYGEFANIVYDLGLYNEKVGTSDDPLRLMAYAYARRSATAYLHFQRIMDEVGFSHVVQVFRGFQQITGQSIEFQEEAFEQSEELINSYISPLEKELLQKIRMIMISGKFVSKRRFIPFRFDRPGLDWQINNFITDQGLGDKYLIEGKFLNTNGVSYILNHSSFNEIHGCQ